MPKFDIASEEKCHLPKIHTEIHTDDDGDKGGDDDDDEGDDDGKVRQLHRRAIRAADKY